MIALQTDQARGSQAVIGIGRKFARRHPALPVGTSELILNDFLAVEPMLDVVALHYEPRPVPLVEWQHYALRCAVEHEGGAGGREPALAVLGVRIIEELIF